MSDATELLFSYGTLQLESMVEITDPAVVATSGETHHPIVKFTGLASDLVEGTVFSIIPQELTNADTYEVAAYRRVAFTLQSGLRAWVYVDTRFAPPT